MDYVKYFLEHLEYLLLQQMIGRKSRLFWPTFRHSANLR
jgi:hypothetical protein